MKGASSSGMTTIGRIKSNLVLEDVAVTRADRDGSDVSRYSVRS
jgi:hypothetical protein